MVDKNKVRQLFEQYDFNKNGVLEKDEFIEIFVRLLRDCGANMPDRRHIEVAEEGFEKFDLNANGSIDLQEFENVITFFVEEKGYEL